MEKGSAGFQPAEPGIPAGCIRRTGRTWDPVCLDRRRVCPAGCRALRAGSPRSPWQTRSRAPDLLVRRPLRNDSRNVPSKL